MSDDSVNYKNVSIDSDPLERCLNKLVFCKLQNGKSFVAKFIAIRFDELYFETSKGFIVMDHRSTITHMAEWDGDVV